jgi:hypothetical protein
MRNDFKLWIRALVELLMKNWGSKILCNCPFKSFGLHCLILFPSKHCVGSSFLCAYQCCGSGSEIRDPVLFTSGILIRNEFFPDLGSRIRPLFWWNFLILSTESMLCYLYNTSLLLKLSGTHKTISSMKKLCLLLLPLFLHRTRIRDEQILGSGSWIKHPRSATWVRTLI